ncbi:MAG: carbonic anhydrase [Hylemonella sp.]|jgi:carbonic anhydrase
MPDELLHRLRRFHEQTFPGIQDRFVELVRQGQHPHTLFIGCSDSRLVPYLLTGAGPGDLFIVRNVAAFVPPYDGTHPAAPAQAPAPGSYLGQAPRWCGFHGTAAAIEFAVLVLQVRHIVVCGHSHCGGIRALYEGVPPEAINLAAWLELGREAVLPVQVTPEALRRTEQRAIVLQLERLMGYPMVRQRVESGQLALHGWHYMIEDGEVHICDLRSGRFVPASQAERSSAMPSPGAEALSSPLFNEIDACYGIHSSNRVNPGGSA